MALLCATAPWLRITALGKPNICRQLVIFVLASVIMKLSRNSFDSLKFQNFELKEIKLIVEIGQIKIL
jgi:hypothetical protein